MRIHFAEICRIFDLKRSGGVAYGVLSGYAVSIRKRSGVFLVTVAARFPDEESKKAFLADFEADRPLTKYRLMDYADRPGLLRFRFAAVPGVPGYIRQLLEGIAPFLERYGAAKADVCHGCGKPVSPEADWILADGMAAPMHEGCIQAMRINENRRPEAPRDRSFVLGLIGALLGGVLGSLLWTGNLLLGWFPFLGAAALGVLATKGYHLFRGPFGNGVSFAAVPVAILFSAVGCFNGELVSLCQRAHNFTPDGWKTAYAVLIANLDPFVNFMFSWQFLLNVFLGSVIAVIAHILTKKHWPPSDDPLHTRRLKPYRPSRSR